MTNNISFKQNIRFVDQHNFHKFVTNPRWEIGYAWHDPLYVTNKYSPNFYTLNVRTCTAGGFRNANGDAVGFHLLDCYENNKHAEDNCNKIYNAVENPISGILVGSKQILGCKYSRSIFSKMEKFFTDRIKGVSIFKEHTYQDGGTSFVYHTETDAWFIRPQWGETSECAKSIEELKKFYKKIIIADGDRIFIGDIEIDPKDISTPIPVIKNQ